MKISFILTGEGKSDLNLVDHIETLLVRAGFSEVSGTSFDPSILPYKIGHTVKQKLSIIRDLYPSVDAVFVHRDADGQGALARRKEIVDACQGIYEKDSVIPVVPVTMLETWLLVDSVAIRRIAGRAGIQEIERIPNKNKLESVRDAKSLLRDALCECSELQGAKLRKFKNLFGQMRARLVAGIDPDGPICELPSYSQLKLDIANLYEKCMN